MPPPPPMRCHMADITKSFAASARRMRNFSWPAGSASCPARARARARALCVTAARGIEHAQEARLRVALGHADDAAGGAVRGAGGAVAELVGLVEQAASGRAEERKSGRAPPPRRRRTRLASPGERTCLPFARALRVRTLTMEAAGERNVHCVNGVDCPERLGSG